MEDVSEIILNLKMVRFKKIGESFDNKITVSIKNKKELTAGDIANFTSAFEILNPELVLCNLDESIDLEIELTIDKGRGYLPAEENKPSEQMDPFTRKRHSKVQHIY